jgi:hypothetical protein
MGPDIRGDELPNGFVAAQINRLCITKLFDNIQLEIELYGEN